MDFLNRAWSLNYIFYLCSLPSNAEVLLITDHVNRMGIDFSIFDIRVAFAVPSSFKEKYNLFNKSSDILYFDETDSSFGEKYFSMIIMDLEKYSYQPILTEAVNNLHQGGYIVLLDWSFSHLLSLKNLKYLSASWINRKSKSSLKRDYNFGGKPFSLEWWFLVEPNLAKPQFLVREAFKTVIPQNSASLFKNFLNRIGIFYLLFHNRILVFRGRNLISKEAPLVQLVRALANQYTEMKEINDIMFRRFLLSKTKVLMVDVSFKEKKYIIRFPLDASAKERLTKQQYILRLLQDKGIPFISSQILLTENFSFPYYIEEKIAGIENIRKFYAKNRKNMQFFYRQIYDKIKKIHISFARSFVMSEKEFNRYVVPKISIIQNFLQNDHEKLNSLQKLQEYFFEAFIDKTFLAGVCHGDLKIQNCIFDSAGQLVAIIDWDMSETDEITLVDITSLLANAIRTNSFKTESLREFMLKVSDIPSQFIPMYKNYFKQTETSYILPFQALMFYWLDRTYKMIRYNSSVNRHWVRKEVYPVLDRIDYFFNNQKD